MAGKLITLPLRVSLRSARLLTRAASGVAGFPLVIPGRAIHIASFGRPDHLVRWLGEAHATEAGTRGGPSRVHRARPKRGPAGFEPGRAAWLAV